MRMIALLLVAAFVPPQLSSQNTELAPGSRVRVITANGGVFGGTLRSLRSDTVVIADSVQGTVRGGRFAGFEPRERTIALGPGAQLQLYTGSRSHVGTGALIGGSIGFAVGAGFMYLMTSDADFGSGSSRVDEVVIGGLLLAIPVALVGAALGSIRTAVWVPVAARGMTVAVLAPGPPRHGSDRIALAIQLRF